MKTILTTLSLSLIAGFAFAHGGVELGPNGGRIVEFSKNETIHGEVTLKGDKFHVAVLDKNMKPVKVDQQVLVATSGNRKTPRKLEVTKDAKGFTVPVVKAGEWLILQFKTSPDAKAVTARMEYDPGNCDGCNSPEWLCKCSKKE